ncbi:hypothetical protein ACJX0J_009846, partial [Zea mays]
RVLLMLLFTCPIADLGTQNNKQHELLFNDKYHYDISLGLLLILVLNVRPVNVVPQLTIHEVAAQGVISSRAITCLNS